MHVRRCDEIPCPNGPIAAWRLPTSKSWQSISILPSYASQMNALSFLCFSTLRPYRTWKTAHNIRASKCKVRMSEEQFDILREDGTPLGYSKPRSQVHRDGDWHRSTHIWVFSETGQVLVQLRAAGKDTFPCRWDVSAAGHITAGDSSLPSARRELEEELGIALQDAEELRLVRSVPAIASGRTEKHGEYLDKEIQDVYVFRPKETYPIEKMVLQEDEVEKVEYWDWKTYRERSLQMDDTLVPRSPMYKQLVFPVFDKMFSG